MRQRVALPQTFLSLQVMPHVAIHLHTNATRCENFLYPLNHFLEKPFILRTCFKKVQLTLS
jgi:hypothetical protein